MNYEKNIKILNDFEKVLSSERPVNFQIKNSDGELVKVSKEEFAEWMVNEKNVKTPPKESLVYGASGDIDGTTVFTERKGKDGVIKESYYEPRSEEEKKQIIERNRKRREQETNQQDFSQKTNKQEEIKEKKDKLAAKQQSSLQNKEINGQNIYYRVGLVSLVLLLISIVVVRMKKKR